MSNDIKSSECSSASWWTSDPLQLGSSGSRTSSFVDGFDISPRSRFSSLAPPAGCSNHLPSAASIIAASGSQAAPAAQKLQDALIIGFSEPFQPQPHFKLKPVENRSYTCFKSASKSLMSNQIRTYQQVLCSYPHFHTPYRRCDRRPQART